MTDEPRDQALEYLYAVETKGELPVTEGRVAGLVTGVLADLDSLDSTIESVSEHWTVSRMPLIDRNVLRIAVFELISEPAVPTAVIISEAVRLAATYSTERSSSFVNGILSNLARKLRPA